MSQEHNMHLPKVRLHFKTSPSKPENPEKDPQLFKQYIAAPCVFQQRLKMQKQIQESYVRFRRKKKNNYLKQFTSLKRHLPLQQKRNSTIMVKHKGDKQINQMQFTLETENNEQRVRSFSRRLQEKSMKSSINEQSREHSMNKQFTMGQQAIHFFHRNQSLPDTYIRKQTQKIPVQLSTKKCQYNKYFQSRRLLNQLKLNSKHKETHLSFLRKTRQFTIDPWIDNNSPSKTPIDEEHF